MTNQDIVTFGASSVDKREQSIAFNTGRPMIQIRILYRDKLYKSQDLLMNTRKTFTIFPALYFLAAPPSDCLLPFHLHYLLAGIYSCLPRIQLFPFTLICCC